MDKLKEYLLRHKEDLDVDSPASDTWENIRSAMPAKTRFPVWVMRYVAAACLILLAGMGIWLGMNRTKATSDLTKRIDGTSKGEPAPGKEKTDSTILQEAIPPRTNIALNRPGTKRTRHVLKSQKPMRPSAEIDAIDKSYSSLIDFQLKKLRATPLYAENSSYFSFYVKQLRQMDLDEQQVRNDIKNNGLTSGFLEQLINVYQQKLNLLKNLQTEVNKMNNKVRQKEGPSQKTEVHYLDI